MLHSTASGYQIWVTAKCVSNNIALAQYMTISNSYYATLYPPLQLRLAYMLARYVALLQPLGEVRLIVVKTLKMQCFEKYGKCLTKTLFRLVFQFLSLYGI